MLEFGFNLNQGCSGVGTCGNGVPAPLFLALHHWEHVKARVPCGSYWRLSGEACPPVMPPPRWRTTALEQNMSFTSILYKIICF